MDGHRRLPSIPALSAFDHAWIIIPLGRSRQSVSSLTDLSTDPITWKGLFIKRGSIFYLKRVE
jgi:hypothetical protein